VVKVEVDRVVEEALRGIPGFVALHRLSQIDIATVLKLEGEAERRALLGAIRAENEGVREALKRGEVFAVAYRPEFFESFKGDIHGSSVVMLSGGIVVGEEVTRGKLNELKGRRDVILIGSSFALYKDRIHRAGGEAKILLPSRPFPPLKHIRGLKDIASGSPSPPVDQYLKEKMKIDTDDPDIGTVLVGFTRLSIERIQDSKAGI